MLFLFLLVAKRFKKTSKVLYQLFFFGIFNSFGPWLYFNQNFIFYWASLNKLMLNYCLFSFLSYTAGFRSAKSLLWVMASHVSGIDFSNQCLLLGRRHSVVGRFNSGQLGFFVLQVQPSPAQQEGDGVLTKLEKRENRAGEHCSRSHTYCKTHLLRYQSVTFHLCSTKLHSKDGA